MRTRICLVAALVLLAGAAAAQSVDVAGVRARGMAGAFTAAADDASATWWNPAGLAGGAFFNAIVEFNQTDPPRDPQIAAPAPDQAFGLSVAIPSLGVSYYHFRVSEMRRSTATAAGPTSRQDLGPAGEGLLVADQVGATVGQSLGDHFVVATTLKLLHGGPTDGSASTAGTLDVGALATFGPARFGVTVRNATEPSLGSGDEFSLERQARVGVAVALPPPGSTDALTLSVDADLTTRHPTVGDQRDAAVGAELWLAQRRVGVRGGISAETVGDARWAGSAGVSAGVKSGVFIEGAVTGGADLARRGWSAGVRVTF